MYLKMKKYDVIIVGGGISGAVAAISAAREGVSVLIVEQYGFLGGMLTAGGVGPMMTFHAGKYQVVRGITDEVIQRLIIKGKSPGHIFDTTGYTYTVTPFDNEGMKQELEEMLLESGGEILYHATVCNCITEGDVLKEIDVCTKSDRIRLSAAVFLDATGDANLAYLSNVKTIKGREADGASQPMTMNMKFTDVDISKVKSYIKDKKNIQEFPRIRENLNIVDKACRLSIGGFEKSFQQGRENGELSFERGEILFFETNNPGEVIVNSTRVSLPDSTDPWQMSQAEIIGRRQARELELFLKKNISGFKNAVLIYTGPVQIGVRSSRQIVGVYTLNENDLFYSRQFEDTIAHGGYKIDVHPPCGGYDEKFKKDFLEKRDLSYGAFYNIPYRSLINNDVKNIITVGRCISASFMAQGAIRVSPIAGAIGHAGGAAASVAIKNGLLPTEIDYRDIQCILKKQNAYLHIGEK